MQLFEFENGIEAHRSGIRDAIEEHGFYVMVEDGYCYSVGLARFGVPEIVAFMPIEFGRELIQVAYLSVRENLCDQDDEAFELSVLSPAPRLQPLDDQRKKTLFYAARTFYGHWEFHAAELVLQ